MRLLLLSLLFFYALPASAITNFAGLLKKDCPSLAAPIAFELLTELNDPFQLSSAVVQLEVTRYLPNLTAEPLRCSASFISDQGHILTANHCIYQACPETDQDGVHLCDIKVNGKEIKARLLLSSNCEAGETKTIQQLATGTRTRIECPPDSDMAILEPLEPVTTPFHCLELDLSATNQYEPVKVVGFPMETFRKTGDSDGVSLYVSRGIAKKSSTCELKAYDTRATVPLLSPIDHERVLQITADAVPGNSGGPVLNPKNRIVGVTHGVSHYDLSMFPNVIKELEKEKLDPFPFMECVGSTLADPLSRLSAYAEAKGFNLKNPKLQCKAKLLPGSPKESKVLRGKSL